MWNLLGTKTVTMLVWDSFGADWAKDIQLQLKLKNLMNGSLNIEIPKKLVWYQYFILGKVAMTILLFGMDQ